jgi:hypothetical protein
MSARGTLQALAGPRAARWTFCALLALFVLVLLPTGRLGSNEEHYFQRAHRFAQPAAFAETSAVFGDSVTRVASDLVIGYPVAWLGYERADALLRLANALLFAAGFAALASAWGLSLLDGVLVLGAFWLLGQQLFGGEWLFQDVEGKTFAYGLVMLGLGLGFRRRWLAADVCFVLATYLHLLVGGFWYAFLLLFRRALGGRLRAVAAQLPRYALGVAPLLVAIVAEQSAAPPAPEPLSSAYIYSLLRNAHHVAPFSDLRVLWSWMPGIVSTLGLLAALWIAGRTSERAVRALLRCVAAVLLLLLLALGASWLDRDTGALGKLFLFRPSSLALLLALVALAAWARGALGAGLDATRWLLAAWLVPVFLWSVVAGKVEQIAGGGAQRAELAQLVDLVQRNTGAADLVLLQPGRDGEPPEVSLPRLLARPTYVSWKFVPTAPRDLLRWYERMQQRARLFDSGCLDKAGLDPRMLVGWTQSWNEGLASCGEELWRSEHYWVVAVR